MANTCVYKIKVKGKENACRALIDMMPLYRGEKEILSEEGTPDDFTLVFRGDCKYSVDGYAGPLKEPRILTDEEIAKIEVGDFWDVNLKGKSVLLNCDIFCNSKDIDDYVWAIYEHYNKGVEVDDECPKELHIKRGRDY